MSNLGLTKEYLDTVAPRIACLWEEDEDGLWHTDCHQIHLFFDGTPTENSYKFCPYCAKPLKEEKYNDQKE